MLNAKEAFDIASSPLHSCPLCVQTLLPHLTFCSDLEMVVIIRLQDTLDAVTPSGKSCNFIRAPPPSVVNSCRPPCWPSQPECAHKKATAILLASLMMIKHSFMLGRREGGQFTCPFSLSPGRDLTVVYNKQTRKDVAKAHLCLAPSLDIS